MQLVRLIWKGITIVDNNKQHLKQVRKGFIDLINESPITLYKQVYPMVSDGKGGMIENPFGTPTNVSIKCRISHERGIIVPKNNTTANGFSTNLERFVQVDYKTTITNGMNLKDFEGVVYKIGAVDPLIKFGGIYGYQAPLIEGSNV